MKLTFDEAIENHRKMWNWIADETEKRKEIVEKADYFKENNVDECIYHCFCCQYAKDEGNIFMNGKNKRDCRLCPIDWGISIGSYDKYQCYRYDTCYDLWGKAGALYEWQSAAKYAREIANLPAREEARKP